MSSHNTTQQEQGHPSRADAIQLPPQLAQRLEFEQQHFGHSQELTDKLHAQAEHKHADILQQRSEQAGREVEHAKQVAAEHHHKGEGENDNARTVYLQGVVQDKLKSVESQQAELNEIEHRLKAASDKERVLKDMLASKQEQEQHHEQQ